MNFLIVMILLFGSAAVLSFLGWALGIFFVGFFVLWAFLMMGCCIEVGTEKIECKTRPFRRKIKDAWQRHVEEVNR